MKKIQYFNPIALRNNAHYKFFKDFRAQVEQFDAKVLAVFDQFALFVSLFLLEDDAFKKVLKSALTAEMQALDKLRDRLFRAMVDMNRVALTHFKDDVRQAAARLKILFDTYGNVARFSLIEETAAIINLMQDLFGKKYQNDVALVGLIDWAKELENANDLFQKLFDQRLDETAERTGLVLKECRHKVDEVYREIIDLINAHITIEGDAVYAGFVSKHNASIDKYRALISNKHHNGTEEPEDVE